MDSSRSIEIARVVATQLFEAEQAIDLAISKVAGLASYMPVARQEIGASASIGQAAMEGAVATVTVLSEARAKMIQTHAALADTQRPLRIRERNFGGFVDKPCFDSHARLRVVPESGKAAA